MGARVFVNVPDHKEIEVADIVKRRMLAHWPITDCTDNFPMALDEAHHRLFVGCRLPSLMLIFDTESGKIVATVPIVEHTDDLFYDAKASRIYVLGEGFIEVWEEKNPNHYQNIGRVVTPPRAHTGLFVPDWGELFVGVYRQGVQDAQILVYQTK